MRKLIKRSLALILIAVFLLPILWNQNELSAKAAVTPSFSEKTVTIKGIGETHQLVINNKIARSKYTWSSLSTSIAKVSKTGLVTSVRSGIATIKCKITYANKKSKTLLCKVNVTVPATAIKISDLPKVDKAYQLALGSTVDLNAVITPSNSTDNAFWYIDKDNVLSTPDCISLDSNNQGIVTGVKAGKSVVRVKAAANATQESDIDDSIIIEVVAPKASVKNAVITGANQITVEFDSPVQQSTLINTDGTLSSNITISLCKDTKKVLATDPGKLTASLSSDMKILTITTDNALQGTYEIDFSSKILLTSGVALDHESMQITYSDNVAPYYTETTYDDSGLIATIHFSESIDFTNFSIKGASVVSSAASVGTTTLSILGNTNNYTISTDKKSISIDLNSIPTNDYGKLFSITIAGIKDMAGNSPVNYTEKAYLSIDNSTKPQAALQSITRTGYLTLTATFDRAIKNPGYIQIDGALFGGVVNTSNTKQVNYTITNTQALLTGVKTISIGYWKGYNTNNDTSTDKYLSWSVDFTIEKISPYIIATDFDATTNIMTLTYSEDVMVPSSSGIFVAKLTTATDDIINSQINYTVVAHTLGKNIVKLKLTFETLKTGSFTFTLPQGLAYDNFMNLSTSKEIVINNSTGSTELQAPYMIKQSTTDLSTIDIMFANKLDIDSATNINNYTIPGVTVLSATLNSNTDAGAIVELKVKSIDATVERPITISGVRGYNNSFNTITSYTVSVLLKENVSPYYMDPPTFDSTSKNIVKLIFSEQIQGSIVATVTQVYGSTSITISNTATINGNCVYLNLGSVPTNGSYLKIDIVLSNLTDLAGNKATIPATLGVAATY